MWRRSATATSSASATRLPRSSAAPVAPAPASSTTSRSPPTDAELLRDEAVLPREEHERRDVSRSGRDEDPRRTLAEQIDGRRVRDPEPQAGAEAAVAVAPDRAFGERDGQAATRNVLGRGEEAPVRRLTDERLDRGLQSQVEAGWAVLRRDARQSGVLAPREARRRLADQDDHVAVGSEGRPHQAIDVLEQADDPDLRRRGDRAAGRFVVERDVAAGDRQAERAARVAHAPDGLRQLPERLGPGRVAVVEAVRHAERPRPGDRHVAGRLRDAHRGPEPRVRLPDGLVAVGGRDERLRCPLDPEDRGALARPGDGIRLDRRVVLLEDRPASRRGWPNRAARGAPRRGPCRAPAAVPRRQPGHPARVRGGCGAAGRRSGRGRWRRW